MAKKNEPDNPPTPANDESSELEEFLDSLGSGISEISLYRIDPNGKQKFVAAGPVSQFTESYVQQTYKGGDYVVRSRAGGRFYRSKLFSVEDPPGTIESRQSPNAEIERLKAEIERQRLEMERDRQQREQRQHELFLESLRHSHNGDSSAGLSPAPVSIAELVGAVKSMRDMAAGGSNNLQEVLNQSLETIERINALRGGDNGAGGAWWQTAISEIGRFAEKLIPFTPQIVSALAPPSNSAPPAGPIVSALVPPPLNTAPPAIAAALPVAAVPPEPVPVSLPPVSVSPQTPAPAPVSSDDFSVYKGQLVQLAIPLALAGSNPELYAELAFDQMRKGDIGILRIFEELMAAKDFDAWFEEIEKLDPTVKTQRDWFSRFHAAVLAEYQAQREYERSGENR